MINHKKVLENTNLEIYDPSDDEDEVEEDAESEDDEETQEEEEAEAEECKEDKSEDDANIDDEDDFNEYGSSDEEINEKLGTYANPFINCNYFN